MRKGLLLGVAFLFYGEANAACMPELDCASLGYKYSYSQCGGKGLACLYDSGKYFCSETVSSCSYTYTAEDCAAECKNVGSLTCSKNGKTYYASCGSSKCSYNQTCNYGTCVTPAPSCTYQYTAQDCTRQCKSTVGTPCTRDGQQYYSSCTNTTTCTGGEICVNGSCKQQNIPAEGNCCDTLYSYCSRGSAYYCSSQYGFPTCPEMENECLKKGGTPTFQYCYDNGSTEYPYLTCEFPAVPPGGECTYTVTADECAAQCKYTGSVSCNRNGTTYYQACGTSKCISGQTCENGTCKTPTPSAPTTGYCCGGSLCGYSGTSHYKDSECQSKYGHNCYTECMQRLGVTCNDMQASCHASGGTSIIQKCDLLSFGSYYLYTKLTCQPQDTIPISGWCCGSSVCHYGGSDWTEHYYDSECQSRFGMSCYNKCMEGFGIACSTMETNCKTSGGYPGERSCGYPGSEIDYGTYSIGKFECIK